MKISCVISSYMEESIAETDTQNNALFTGPWANTFLLLEKNTFLARKIC